MWWMSFCKLYGMLDVNYGTIFRLNYFYYCLFWPIIEIYYFDYIIFLSYNYLRTNTETDFEFFFYYYYQRWCRFKPPLVCIFYYLIVI